MKWCVLRYARAKIELVVNAVVVASLVACDVRDLLFKIDWLGPYDTFRFQGYPSYYTLRPTHLELAVNLTHSGQVLLRPNGWSSFLEKCESMTVLGSEEHVFRVVLAQNCTMGTRGSRQTLESLVLTSSIRSDSVAWACCQLLDFNIQPSICGAHVVRDFERRYNMETKTIPHDWIARPGSKEEAELLSLLSVIGKSAPLNQVTCVEGFEFTGQLGKFASTIFGCGAPNYFESAFAGVRATKLAELVRDKAYLTMDNINAMGFRYGIRENCVSEFEVLQADSDGKVVVSHTSTINFTTYGQLYALQIVIDTVLLLLNALSALQIAVRLVLPAYRLKSPVNVENFVREGYARFLAGTLYRSHVVTAMVTVSQLLSWLLIIPSAVIWTWGNSASGKLQSYLSVLRIWALVLIVVNALWDLLTFWKEKLAYQIVKLTFVAPVEIILIVAGVSFWDRDEVFGVSEKKVSLEHQREIDFTSFKDVAGTSNAFDQSLDFQLNTPAEVLWIIYKPLFRIVLVSVAVVGAVAATKFAFIYWNPLNLTLEHEREYSRLPLELLLNKPIRARSMVRFSLALDHVVNDELFVFAPLVLEFGVFFLDGRMKPRWGFLNPIAPVVHVDHTVISDKISPLGVRDEEHEHEQQMMLVIAAVKSTQPRTPKKSGWMAAQ